MRNRVLLLVATVLMATFTASAQEAERKLLTIEDVVLNRELNPKSYPVKWVGESDSYSKVEGTEVLATFTMSYYKYNFVCNDPTLKQFILDGGGNLDAHDKLLIKNN